MWPPNWRLAFAQLIDQVVTLRYNDMDMLKSILQAHGLRIMQNPMDSWTRKLREHLGVQSKVL